MDYDRSLGVTVWSGGIALRVVNHIFEPIFTLRSHRHGIGIRQHASAIGEIQDVSILRNRIHLVAGTSGKGASTSQPLLEVPDIEFHSVHDAVDGATRRSRLGSVGQSRASPSRASYKL